MTSPSPSCSSPAFKRILFLVGASALLSLGCSSSGTGGTTGGLLCTPGQAYPCTGVSACKGQWTCQPEGTSYGACECMAGTTGTTGTGGKATSTAGTTGSSSGGGLASASSTGAAPSTTAIGAVIIPGPNAGLITLTIDSENLGSNPTPGGVVNASGTWNTGSTFGGSYNTASDVLSVSSNAFSAGFMGMLAGEAINGDWVGDSYDLPFSLITVANGATVRAFCGSNGAETESLGVVFSTDGTLAGVQDGTAGVGKIGGSYSDGLATVTGIGSFIFTTDSDGGESFVGTGWTMAPCQ